MKKKKKDRFRSKEFLDFIRSLPCVCCTTLGQVQRVRTTASHMVSVARADGSDALAVPACWEHHPQSTRTARNLVASIYGPLPALHFRLWREFLIAEEIQPPEIITQDEFEAMLELMGMRQRQRRKVS